MLGSSSTTSSRASGAARSAELPDTILRWSVRVPSSCPQRRRRPLRSVLDATCEVAGSAPSAGRGHRPTAAPVADRVVLGAAQPPAAAQVGPDGADGGGLGGHPGEDVVGPGRVERRRRRRPAGCSRPAARRRGAASARSTPAGATSGCSSAGPATSSSASARAVPGSAAARMRAMAGSGGLVTDQQQPAGGRARPAAPLPATAEQRTGARGGRPGGGRTVAVQHEVDRPARRWPGPGGGRCSCAGSPRGCPAGQTIRPSRATSRPARRGVADAGDQQGQRRAGGGDGLGRARQHDHAARTASRRDGGDGSTSTVGVRRSTGRR